MNAGKTITAGTIPSELGRLTSWNYVVFGESIKFCHSQFLSYLS